MTSNRSYITNYTSKRNHNGKWNVNMAAFRENKMECNVFFLFAVVGYFLFIYHHHHHHHIYLLKIVHVI